MYCTEEVRRVLDVVCLFVRFGELRQAKWQQPVTADEELNIPQLGVFFSKVTSVVLQSVAELTRGSGFAVPTWY